MAPQLCKAHRRKGVVKRIKQLSPECEGIHCILHREALVTKKPKLNTVAIGGQENELNDVLREIVNIVNSIRKSAKQQRLFSKLCNEMDSTSKKPILSDTIRGVVAIPRESLLPCV